jgi:AAA family ATP:ADP antiporter
MENNPKVSSKKRSPMGKWRRRLWPIYSDELKKFIPMALMFFLISFNYNVLRSYKDSIIVTAKNSGAETIPFIKVWVVLPAAILFTLLYTRLSNRFNREKVFYIIISIFLGFFFIFTFVLYPAQDFFHPNALADRLQSLLPLGCKGLIATFRNWTFSLFYVVSELWSTMIFTVLFWGFSNEVTPVSDAKRYYGLLMTAGNIAGIFSGQIAILFSQNFYFPTLPYGKDAWDQSIFFLTCALLLAGLLIIAIFRWLNVKVIRHEQAQLPQEEAHKKIKMSMRENFAYILSSKYLLCIALIVLGYNVAINLVEVVWKDQMKQLFPDPCQYTIYMGKVNIAMSLLATILGFFTVSNIIRKSSWTLSAILPALIVGGTGFLFFALVAIQQWNISFLPTLFGLSPLLLCVSVGSIQNCLSRATKYTLFDATKEIAFIPLNNESKLKGKAAIDGVGSRIGKSGGSMIHQGLIMIFSTVAASSSYVAIIFLGIIVLWGLAVVTLGRQFDILSVHDAKLDLSPTRERKPDLANKPI